MSAISLCGSVIDNHAVSSPEPYIGSLMLIQNNSLIASASTLSGLKYEVFASLQGPNGDNNVEGLKTFLRGNYPQIYRVCECESHWTQEAVGKAGEIGACQYMPSTWADFSRRSGLNGDINSLADQVELTIWAWEHKLQKHWTCYKLLYGE